MKREKIYMGVSTFARLISGLLVFVVAARFLGPNNFGIFATSISYCTLLGLISDYGLSTYALREAGANRSRSAMIVRCSLNVKVLTSVVTIILGAGFLACFSNSTDITLIYICIFVGIQAVSFADLSFVIDRVSGRFEREAKIVGFHSVLFLTVVAFVASYTENVLYTSIAYLLTRLLYVINAILILKKFLCSKCLPWIAEWDAVKAMLKGSASYAVDGVFTNTANQIDVVLVSLFLDVRSAGIYQAGARLVQGISPFAVILSTVYLPRLSEVAATGDKSDYKKLAGFVTREFLVISVLLFMLFYFVAPILTDKMYGQLYSDLKYLWPGFAFFVLFRFAAAGFSIQLVAKGWVFVRLIALFISMLTNYILFYILVPVYGMKITSTILALSSLVPLVFYIAYLRNKNSLVI